MCCTRARPALCSHPVLSKSAFVLGQNALGERLPQIPTLQCGSSGPRVPPPPHGLPMDPRLPGGFGGAPAGHWTRPEGSSREHRAQPRPEGCQQLCATCAAWHWGEPPCPEIVPIWLKSRISGSCKSPRNKSCSCPSGASCGARNSTSTARKQLGGSGAPAQAGTSTCGSSYGDLSLHEMNPKPG